MKEEEEVEELVKEVKMSQQSKEAADKVRGEKEAKEVEEENEFILDGFDFSTGTELASCAWPAFSILHAER